MSTFLFDDIIFGPVRSRRLGASLGVNLLPVSRKFCNFDCIYCECGWNPESGGRQPLPSRELLRERLEARILEIREQSIPLDRITFAGNGEPTIHPDFAGIVADTVDIRDRLVPGVGIAVLSNASRLDDPSVFEALGSIDMNILKLDSVNEETVRLLNQPPPGYSVARVIEGMKRFNGRFILQTLFIRGNYGGKAVDNSADGEVDAWLDMVREVRPQMVMVYTIARGTPVQSVERIEAGILESIASRVRSLGIEAQVSG